MSTHVTVNTYTHSVTFVAGQMIRSLKEIIKWTGLDPNRLFGSWATIEHGISVWLGSRHLNLLVLEIFNPRTDVLIGRWDFEISYSYGSSDDGSMWVDTEAIRFALAKCGAIASTCDYQIKIENLPGAPAISGWSSTSYRSTAGFSQHCVGTTIGANTLGSQASYWRKS
jgi:hypothetical protein